MLSNSTKVLTAGVVLLASIAGGAFLWFPNEAVCYENCPLNAALLIWIAGWVASVTRDQVRMIN